MLFILRFLTIFLYIFTIYLSVVKCYNVKSINTYKKLTIEDGRVCSPITKRRIELKKNEYHALLISQTSTKDHSATWPIHWLCKYTVDSSNYGGLFAVIQNINFRRNGTNGECIDYVSFRGKDGKNTRRICGNFPLVDREITEYEGQISYDGIIETEIYISREKLLNGENMDLEIAYTAFKRCNVYTQPFTCMNNSALFCINDTFFNDSIVNCPFEMDCRDEGTCLSFTKDSHKLVTSDDSSMVTKVVLSAVTSLFVSFVCVIVVMWLCRKMGSACCLSMNICGRNTPETSRPQSRVIEMQNRDDADVFTAASPPSAPDYDKDLPPSYDSLFPHPETEPQSSLYTIIAPEEV